MTDLRKSFLALAVVAILLSLGSTPANAATVNPAFVCNANASVPPLVRSEGITELMGDLILNCTGGNPTVAGAPVPLSNVQIFLNTNLTSRIVGSGNLSEATLMIDEPLAPAAARVPNNLVFANPQPPPQVLCIPQGNPCPIVGDGFGTPYETISRTPTVYSGRQAAVGSVSWNGVPIDAPGTVNTRVIRITNVRANACQLGTSSTLIPTQIVMFISVTGSQQVTINNPQQTVAFIQQGVSVSGASNSDLQCLPPSVNPGANSIRVQEGFASSFKRRNITLTTDGTTSPAPRAQNIPGYPYNTETGFYSPALFSATPGVGLADFGTRIRITFNNIGNGVIISVPLSVPLVVPGTSTATTPAQPPSPVAPGVTTGRLTLVQTDQWGNSAPGFTAIAGTVGPSLAAITSSGANSGYAVYEVVNSDPNVLESAAILVTVNTANANPQGPVSPTVRVSLAPAGGPLASIQTAGQTADFNAPLPNAPLPRFCDKAINPCPTCSLLFPFVSDQSGFKTRIAIANTSLDPFGTSTQQGPVTLYYFGGVQPGNRKAPLPVTSTGTGALGGTVPAGCELVFTLMSGGGVTNCPALGTSTTTIPAAAGFEGYIIAVSSFQYCHAFAFISNGGGEKGAEGYLAIHLDKAGLERTGIPGENKAH